MDTWRWRPGHVRRVAVHPGESSSGRCEQEVNINTSRNVLPRFQDGAVVDKRPVSKHICSQEFLDLIPGHAYILTVQSLSGKLSNRKMGTGRTGRG